MNLVPEQFEEDDIERHFYGAGVVPVARDSNGKMRVLLGRERFLQQYKGSCRWSGFEGSRKEGESVYTTALRECREETLGCVETLPCERCTRIVLKVTTLHRPARYQVTYLLRLPEWDAELPHTFAVRRKTLEELDFAMQEWRLARTETLLTEHVEALIHDSFADARQVTRHCDQTLDTVKMNVDYMEKDQVRWWTLDELDAVYLSHGYHAGERFRPFFLPVLQLILEELRSCESSTVCCACSPTEDTRPAEEHSPDVPVGHEQSSPSDAATPCARSPRMARTLPETCPAGAVACTIQTPSSKTPPPARPATPTPTCALRRQSTR